MGTAVVREVAKRISKVKDFEVEEEKPKKKKKNGGAIVGALEMSYIKKGEAIASKFESEASSPFHEDEWIKRHDDKSNRSYYENAVTGESRWERPEGGGGRGGGRSFEEFGGGAIILYMSGNRESRLRVRREGVRVKKRTMHFH